MADNRLQIIAELIDRVSPAAKKMEQAFKNLQNATGKQLPEAFKKYQNAINANEKALQNYGKGSERVRRELRAFQETIQRVSPTLGRLTESIGSFSTGSGAAVGAMAAVGAALVVAGKSAADFAGKMKEIKFGSAESGLGTLQLKQMQQALEEFNISQEETTAGFKGLRGAMTDARGNIGKFADSIVKELGPAGLQMAAPVIEMIRAGKSTAEVFSAVEEQVDKIKKMFPGAKGEDIAGRFVQQFGLPAKFARPGGEGIREKLAVIERLGSTGAEMKEAAEQAELLRQKLFEGGVILDKWKLLLGTDITKAFLAINRLLDKIDEKYNSFMGGNVLRKLLGPNTYDQMFPPTFNERFGGEAAPGSGGGGPTFRKGIGPGARTTTGGGAGDPRGLEGYIREQAAANNIDPNVAVAVARSEGLSNPVGDGGRSHGAFQLYTGGGLGNTFQKETGLDPADPANERATIAWAMKYAGRTKDWSPWHGAARVGVGRNQGFNYSAPPAAPPGAAPPASAPGGSGGPPGALKAAGGYNPDIASVDPRLRGVLAAGVAQFEERNPGYHVAVTSGRRMGAGQAQHASEAGAIDLQITGPDGKPFANLGPDTSGKYTELAQLTRGEMLARHPELAKDLNWGGYFGADKRSGLANPATGAGRPDLMHYDLGGRAYRGRAGITEAYERLGVVPGVNYGDRVNLNRAMSGAPASVSGTGKIDVNVNAVGKTARSQGLFKNINQQRNIQMQPASSGAEQSVPSLAGVM